MEPKTKRETEQEIVKLEREIDRCTDDASCYEVVAMRTEAARLRAILPTLPE